MVNTRKGFTLLEMMVVITLMGLFFVITSAITKDTRSYQTDAERLANTIYDTVRNARNNMLIGRGAYSGWVLDTVIERTISISNTGIVSRYKHDATNSGNESVLPFPFFDNDKDYKITNIAVSSGGVINGVIPAWDGSGLTSAAIVFDTNSDISISTFPVVSNIRTLKVTAGYRGFEQSVVIDRVTGTIEVRKSTED